jgi:replication fork protection complex subunit Csm3/Swi3
MVEKMGHKRRMQIARNEWISEGKPRSSVDEFSLSDEPTLPPGENGNREKTALRVAPIFEKTSTERPKTPAANVDEDMGDLYDATPRAARQQPAEKGTQGSIFGNGNGEGSLFGPAKDGVVDDGPPEDDLDALLAEEEMIQAEKAKVQPASNAAKLAQENNFDDEMEAMAEMDGLGDMW